MDPMFCSARSAPLKAVMLIGVACTVESRFSAVTTISSRSLPRPGAVSPAGEAAGPPGSGSAKAGAHINPAQTMAKSELTRDARAACAAHDFLFIDCSP
jgi:hypothetical protein